MKKTFALCLVILTLCSLCACEGAFAFSDRLSAQDAETTLKNEENTAMKLSSLYPILNDLQEEDVASVKIAAAYIGVSPAYATPEITESTDGRDIAYNLSFLKNATLTTQSYTICGGRYAELTLVLKNGESHTFLITNGFLNQGDAPLTLAFENYEEQYPKIEFGE